MQGVQVGPWSGSYRLTCHTVRPKVKQTKKCHYQTREITSAIRVIQSSFESLVVSTVSSMCALQLEEPGSNNALWLVICFLVFLNLQTPFSLAVYLLEKLRLCLGKLSILHLIGVIQYILLSSVFSITCEALKTLVCRFVNFCSLKFLSWSA